MLSRLYSLKLFISLALVTLTLLAFGLALYSSSINHDYTIDAQHSSQKKILSLVTRDVINDLQQIQLRFGNELIADLTFIELLGMRDSDAVGAWLEQVFSRSDSVPQETRQKTIIVRDTNGDVFSRKDEVKLSPYNGCLTDFNSSGIPDSFDNQLPDFAICSFEGNIYSQILILVPGVTPNVYLQIVNYADDALKSLADHVDFPVQISSRNGNHIFRSPDWPGEDHKNRYLLTDYRLFGSDLAVATIISSASDLSLQLERIERNQINFLLLAFGVSLASLVICIFLLDRAFLPISKLKNSVGELLTGKYALISAKKLPSELRDLVLAYNNMVEGLEVETTARQEFEDKLRSEKDFISTTLNSINDPVIVIDSKGLIKLVNPGAENLFGVERDQLIDSLIHEFLVLYENQEASHIINLEYLITGKQVFNSIFCHKADKRVIELEFSSSPMIDTESEDVGYVIILKDISEARRLRRKLSYEASHDPLTRFFNRSAFERKFENLIADDHGVNPQHVLAYLDLDQFSVVNETCGSAAGDLLLKQVGSTIKSRMRKSDILSRLSGDEFGIIMPYLDVGPAGNIMQDIIEDIQKKGFKWDDKQYQVTCSIGVMAFGQEANNYADFYSRVNTACYLAKENGGNQFRFIEENDEKLIAKRESMDWVSAIMKGFSDDLFCLYVQPIVPMSGGGLISHYEVLIRYRKDNGSITPPDEFLPTAERYNLIEKIDRWVVASVIRWLQQNSTVAAQVKLSINLSGRSIGSKPFHEFLHAALVESGLDLSLLCFEITETSFVSNIDKSIEFINTIKQLGVSFSLDDFGTGLSSFSYLKQFPVDYLKIDGEFIRDIVDDQRSFVFVRSMSEVGHCLDMKVIAEYVESDLMLDRLREANVDYLQGFSVGKPVAIESLQGTITPVI